MKKNTNISFAIKSVLMTISVLCVSLVQGRAQEAAQAAPAAEAAGGSQQFVITALWVFVGIEVLVILLFLITMNNLLKALVENQLSIMAKSAGPEAEAKVKEIVKRPGVWSKLMQKLTDSKPIEKEADILLDHDYDGIHELDNHLPPWWKWMFYITIFWSVLYIINYHISPLWNEGYSQTAEYNAEMEKAEKALAEYRKTAADNVDETNVVLLTDDASLAKGKSKFMELCAACHGDLGQGGIGPNLTDAYWLHGGDFKSVFKTIKYGVVEKGMISWKDEMKPSEMQAVTSYIFSLQGSNPPGAKEPQGTLYTPEAPANTDSTGTAKTDSITTVK
jgi:cytochrome c oxidase cbb3-type subunit 3